MRDFEKPLNDNKCPMRDLQANSGHCGIVVYTYSTRSTGCAESVIFNVNKLGCSSTDVIYLPFHVLYMHAYDLFL